MSREGELVLSDPEKYKHLWNNLSSSEKNEIREKLKRTMGSIALWMMS